MAFVFQPKAQAKITFPVSGTADTVSIPFFAAKKNYTADEAAVVAGYIFNIVGTWILAQNSERCITEVATNEN